MNIIIVVYNNGISNIVNLLHDATNQPFKFRTKNLVEINDESHGTYDDNIIIKFKTSMIKSNLCDYSDKSIQAKRIIEVANTEAAGAPVNKTNKKVTFKNSAQFTNYISEINNTQVDDAQDIDTVMPMYKLIEYSDIYSKTSGSLWQYHRDEPALDNNNIIIDFPANNDSISSKFKQQITGQTGNAGTKA